MAATHTLTPAEKVGRAVRALRARDNLSIDDAAAVAKMSPTTWAAVEKGRSIRPMTFAAVEYVLKLRPGALQQVLDTAAMCSADGVAVQVLALLLPDTAPQARPDITGDVRKVLASAYSDGTKLAMIADLVR